VTKLRNLLAAALLVSAVSLNASEFVNEDVDPALSAPQQAGGMCWIYAMGRWWYVPC
jgi:hypothetical protein